MSEDDLWVVGTDGGAAWRLTHGPGRAITPKFSPDGSQIAYAASDEGDQDVWLVDADGGEPTRLTHLGGATSVIGWVPDGSAVWAVSNAREPFARSRGLFRVPIDGSGPEPTPRGNVNGIANRPDGATVLALNGSDPARWKRYRGGLAGTLWLGAEGLDGAFAPFMDRLEGNLASPLWVDGRVWFVSDHEGVGHLYRATVSGRGLSRVSEESDFYVRNPDTDGHRVVWSAGADLHLHDIVGGETTKLDVSLPSTRPGRRRKFVPVGKHLESVTLHPEGHSVGVVARGGAWTMPLWEGTPRRHGPISVARQRLFAWMADGERAAYVSDADGDEALVVVDADGTPVATHTVDVGRIRTLTPSPVGDLVAVTNHRFEVQLVDAATGEVTDVHRDRYGWINGTAWSPDGRWLAFAANDSELVSSIRLYDTNEGTVHRVTNPEFADHSPIFDPKGRYLAFLSQREFAPVPDLLFHDHAFVAEGRPYLIPLTADRSAPFSALRETPRAPGAPVNGNDKNKEDGPPPVAIDLDGIDGRSVPAPVPPGVFLGVGMTDTRLLVTSRPLVVPPPTPGAAPTPRGLLLQSIDLTTGQVDKVADDVRGFTLTPKRHVLAMVIGERLRVVTGGWKDSGDGKDHPGRETGWVDLGRIRAEVRPDDEWRQMLREAWRLQRDHFWEPTLAGVDWEAVLERWLPLVDRVGVRSEFSDLVWEMQGELGTSHAYEMGGDYQPGPRYPTGSLGTEFTWGPRTGWRIGPILRGDSWKPGADSPLAAPGVDVAPGDRLLSVDGVAVDGRDPHRLLVGAGGAAVTLELRRGRRKPHRAVVVPLHGEHQLRYRAWVEAKRARVHEATDGRLGYLHIPDMGSVGFAEFHRGWHHEVQRDGLVVDVRFNGGGNVSQLLLERLRRVRLGWRVTRWHGLRPFPYESPSGVMVALTNEMAGSDGDIFSHTWKLHGLGPLIGTRTWGGVVGIWPQQSLVDGTTTTQPEFGSWFVDVGYGVENYGTDPDIEVVIPPQDYAAGADPQLERGIAEALLLLEGVDLGPPEELLR